MLEPSDKTRRRAQLMRPQSSPSMTTTSAFAGKLTLGMAAISVFLRAFASRTEEKVAAQNRKRDQRGKERGSADDVPSGSKSQGRRSDCRVDQECRQ